MNLREYREAAGMTVEEAAERLHLASQRIERLEAGITPVWTADLVMYLALLQVDPRDHGLQ